ncbi:MAG: LmeA family phospholipid-binding protein [Candidatus Rokubacteria bacterium]|nr:LmeA family phospholipid-binding protein [Candidatus Rokubacteria bacterium]
MKPSLRDWLLLAGLFASLVLVVGIWVTVDRRPPEWDYANHLERAVRCHQILSEQGWRGAGKILEMSSFYPPVVPCGAAFVYFLYPITPLTSQAVMLGFLGLALVSIFLLGCHLFDGPTGLLAALLFGAAPFVVYSGTKFQLDLPLAAVAVLALLILVRTDDFSRRSWSITMGLALALGMLVKPPFAVYLFAPFALVIGRAFRAHDRGRRGLNLALALLLGSLLSLPWYGPRLFGLPMQIANRSFKQAAQAGYPEAFTTSSLLIYPRALLPMFGLLAALLFAWGLLALAREPRARGLLWAASLVPFGVFLFIRNKDLRYVLPILPVGALIGAASLRALAPAWRRALAGVAILASIVQVGVSAFGIPPAPGWTPFGITLLSSFSPSPAEWPHRQILDVIAREAAGVPVTVSVVPNDNYFSAANFRYYAVRDRLPLTVTRAWGEYPLGVDFIVLKTGSQGPEFSIAKPRRIMERLAAGDPAFERAFPVIWQGRLPDGSAAIVRRRRLTPVTDVGPADLARQLKQGIARFLEPYAREVEGLRVDLAYSPDALLKGEIRRVEVAARSARIAEFSRNGAQLRVAELRFTLEGVRINPYRLVSSGDVEPLAIERFRVEHLLVTEEDLRAFLTAFRGLRGLRLGLEEGVVSVVLNLSGPDLAARLRLSA